MKKVALLSFITLVFACSTDPIETNPDAERIFDSTKNDTSEAPGTVESDSTTTTEQDTLSSTTETPETPIDSTESNLSPLMPQVEYGSFALSGAILSNSTTAKEDVPDCSSIDPDRIVYTIEGSDGTESTYTKEIDFTGDTFRVLGAGDSLNIGEYLLTDAFLIIPDGNTSYAVPDNADPRFNFGSLIDSPLPITFNIASNNSTQLELEALCYTDVEFKYNGELGFDGQSTKLYSIFVYAFDSCATQVGLYYPTRGESRYPLPDDTPISYPFGGSQLRLYDIDGNLLGSYTLGAAEYTYREFDEEGNVITETIREFGYGPYAIFDYCCGDTEPYFVDDDIRGMDLDGDGYFTANDAFVANVDCNN